MTVLSWVMPLANRLQADHRIGDLSAAALHLSFLPFSETAFSRPHYGCFVFLPFLFMEGNSMWGGNIPSTLAGTFCYSMGFSLGFCGWVWCIGSCPQQRTSHLRGRTGHGGVVSRIHLVGGTVFFHLFYFQ
jgi:hypothetical protein